MCLFFSYAMLALAAVNVGTPSAIVTVPFVLSFEKEISIGILPPELFWQLSPVFRQLSSSLAEGQTQGEVRRHDD